MPRLHRGLVGWQRRPVVTVFAVAFTVRSVVAVVIFLRYNGTLFLDDATYSDLAAQRATGDTANWDVYTHFLYERTATMLVPLTALYKILVPSRIIGQLLVAFMASLAAAATAATARRSVGTRAGWLAGLGVALMPSQVLFSSTTLKDGFVWALLASLALAFSSLHGRPLRRCWLPIVGIALVLLLLGYLRLHTQVIAALALVLASPLARPRGGRLQVAALLVSVAVAAPWVAGTGPLGLRLVVNGSSASYLSGLRAAGAVGGSALDGSHADPTSPAANASASPSGPSRTTSPDDTVNATLAYFPHGVVAVLLRPFPWEGGSAIYRFAGLENIVWYGLLLTILTGLPSLWRKRQFVALPILVSAGSLAMWALVEGNLGTAFRHRGEFVWAMWLLTAVVSANWRSSGSVTTPEDGDAPAAECDVHAVRH